MKRAISILLISMLATFLPQQLQAKRCTGSATCTACTSCSSCRHCAQEGGSCGVCGGGDVARSKAEAIYTRSPNSKSTGNWMFLMVIGLIVFAVGFLFGDGRKK